MLGKPSRNKTENKTEIELIPCIKKTNYWGNNTIRDSLAFETLKCADLSHVKLTGDFFSKKFVTAAFGLKRCIKNQTNNCANKTEIDEFFDKKTLQVLYTNTHLNTDYKPD